MILTKSHIRHFHAMIFLWWKTHKRELPWRYTQDPYKIAISEIMLQQTQVSRVIAKYREFIKRYPTVFDLAMSSPASVLRLWKGMGYNKRAVYLQKMAAITVEKYNGKFPEDENLLTKLPGIGTYTARAILVFAYKKDIAMVDTNIRQVITHFFFNGKLQKPEIIQKAADKLLPEGLSWEWHQALMDYGALALVSIRDKQQTRKQQSIPFKESNRFYRGRIIDLLREKSIRKDSLIIQICKTYHKKKPFVSSIIESLIHDGLVLCRRNLLLLPE